MLAISRMNISDYCNELPNEIHKIIEDYTTFTFTITCENLSKCIIKVNLVNIFNKKKFKEIYLYDTAMNDIIKLSSDGKQLIYLDVNFNMVYYNIDSKTKYKISLKGLNLNLDIKADTLKYYYFDRNGLFFIITNINKTYVFNIMESKFMYELPTCSLIVDNLEMISSDYKKIFIRTNNCVFVYDLLTGGEIYYNNTEINHLGLVGTDHKINYIITAHDPQYTICINNIHNNEFFAYNEEDIDNITCMILDNNLLVVHFYNYIKIINIKDNKIKQIDNVVKCLNNCNMELLNNKYLIIKKNGLMIEIINI